MFRFALGKVGLGGILLEGCRAHDIAPLEGMVNLRRRQCHALAGFADLDATRRPQRVGGAQAVSIKAHAAAHRTDACATITQLQFDCILGLPRDDPHRRAHCAAVQSDLDDVGIDVAAAQANSGIEPQSVCRGGTQIGGVVPGELGERLGQLLQPAVVGEPAVEQARVGPEHEFQ